jgi:glycosyltransferase involved in cell wall biosynthesis
MGEPGAWAVISCVMAAYNTAGTILAAVESVLGQTWTDLELIIVDDGSTDETWSVLAGIRDARVVMLRQPHSGPSTARNRALAQARGEFVASIDADDIWLPRKLELQARALRERTDAAVAYGWTDCVDADLRPAGTDERPTFEGNVLEALLCRNFIFCGSNTLIRRAALQEVGGFDETLEAAEDWELHTRLAAGHAFVAVPEVVVWYRRSPRSLSSRFWLMERNFLAASGKVFAAVAPDLRRLEGRAKGSFYRYLLVRASQSEGTPGKWKALPRYAAYAIWHDPGVVLRVGPLVWGWLVIIAAFMGRWIWLDGLTFPPIADEPHFWRTSQRFLHPSIDALRRYDELNTPLPFLIFGALERLFHTGAFAGRLLTYCLSAAIMFAVARREMLAALGLLLFPYYLLLTGYYYTDFIAGFFVFIGFRSYLRGRHLLAAGSFALAIACRQYAVAIPLAIFMHELVESRFRLNRAWLWPMAAGATLLGWIWFFGGLAPAVALPQHTVKVPEVQMQWWRASVDASLYALAGLGVYFVIPEWLLFRRRPWEGSNLWFVALMAGVLLWFVAMTAPMIAHGLLMQVLRRTAVAEALLFGFALLTVIRFARLNLEGWLVLAQLAVMLKAFPWDKYLLPLLLVLWSIPRGASTTAKSDLR